jgi:hypothetical protein
MSAQEVQPDAPIDANRKSPWDAWHIVLGVLALAFAITSIWLWTEVAGAKSDASKAIAQNDQRNQELLNTQGEKSAAVLMETRKEAALNQATAFAAAIQPIMSFKAQIPEITDRSVQGATESLARQGSYSFVAITDADGKVIASSDLAIIGRDFAGNLQEGVGQVDGENQAMAKIGSTGNDFGWVVLRLRNGG